MGHPRLCQGQIREIWRARVFPVDIDTVEIMLLDKIGDAGGHLQAVGWLDTFAEDVVGVGVGREGPATESQDPFDILEALELAEFIRRQGVANQDLVRRCQCAKSKMNMGVFRSVDLERILVKALAAQPVTLEVGDLDGAGPGPFDHVHATVGNAAVGAGLGRPRRAGVGVDAIVLGDAALAPDIATGVQRAGVEIGDFGTVRWRLGARLLRTAHGIGDRAREWGLSCAQTHGNFGKEQLTSRPPPCVLVEVLELLVRQPILGPNFCAAVTTLGLVREARSIRVGLGTEIRKTAAGTAHMLLWLQ